MGLFNEDQVKRLNGAGIKAEINKDYTPKEREDMAIKLSEYIFSQSTKNDDIPNMQSKFADITNIL